MTLLLKTAFGLSLGLAAALAVLFCGLMGGVIELLVYRRLRRRGSSSVVLLLASLGVYIALQNSISLTFGDGAQTLRSRAVATSFDVFGAKVTQPQVLLICATAGLAACVALLLARTRIGRAVRAVASEPELAGICGVDTEAVILWTFVGSSMLAGLVGVLVCLDLDMTPTMGMHALLMAVVAVVVGGSGSIWRILLVRVSHLCRLLNGV